MKRTTARVGDTGPWGRHEANKKFTAEKRAARRFGEFARSVRRNLRQAHRVLERAEQAARRCYEKAGAAMLDAKTSSGMSEEGFAAWLAPFELSQDRLVQCLELGQVVRPTVEKLGRQNEKNLSEKSSRPGQNQMSLEL